MTSNSRTNPAHPWWRLSRVGPWAACALVCFAASGCAWQRAPQIRIDGGSLAMQGDTFVKGGLLIGPGAALHLQGALNQGTYAFPIENQGLLEFRGPAPQRITGALLGRGLLHIAAPAEVTLAADNGFEGAIQIDRGALLRISGTLGCGRFGGAILNQGVLVFAPAGQQVLAGTLAGGGELRLEGGTLVLGGEPPGASPRRACVVRAAGRASHLKRYPDHWLD